MSPQLHRYAWPCHCRLALHCNAAKLEGLKVRGKGRAHGEGIPCVNNMRVALCSHSIRVFAPGCCIAPQRRAVRAPAPSGRSVFRGVIRCSVRVAPYPSAAHTHTHKPANAHMHTLSHRCSAP